MCWRCRGGGCSDALEQQSLREFTVADGRVMQLPGADPKAEPSATASTPAASQGTTSAGLRPPAAMQKGRGSPSGSRSRGQLIQDGAVTGQHRSGPLLGLSHQFAHLLVIGGGGVFGEITLGSDVAPQEHAARNTSKGSAACGERGSNNPRNAVPPSSLIGTRLLRVLSASAASSSTASGWSTSLRRSAFSCLLSGWGLAQLAADDRDLRSHSLKALLHELDQAHAQHWQRQARVLDKLYAPTRYPDALGDELPAEVFGPEDGASALLAAEELLEWASDQLQ
jgi:hypothetical protein